MGMAEQMDSNEVRITPEMMMLAYFDQMASRLSAISTAITKVQDRLNQLTEESALVSRVYAVTENPVRVPLNSFGMTILNDGINSVYLLSDKGKPIDEAGIAQNNSVSFDFKTKKLRLFYLVCAAGDTASVRVMAW